MFRTTAPTTGSTYWRMFQGGIGAGNERGQLFADPSATHFNINAPQGHLRLLTNTTERARINASGSYTIGSFTGQVASGFLGVSPNSTLWAAGNPGPFSRLHLHDGTTVQSASYRPWMKNGVTFTGNQDHSFLGQKSAAVDYTDMVLHWSDNPGVTLKDRLRFIFTSGYSSIATSGAQSTEGLEAMRIFPARFEEAYIGFGDFYAANLADPSITEPTERVDLVNGRLRIRELPEPSGEATVPFKVMVVDDSAYPSGERGVVKWRDPNQLDCKWQLTTGIINHLYTAVGTPGVPCPDDIDAVGIGVDLAANPAPSAKFTVKTDVYNEGESIVQTHSDADVYGLRIDARGGTQNNYGARILATANNTSVHNYGLFTEAFGSTPRSRAVSARTNGATYTAYCGEFLAYDAASWTTGVTGRAYGGQARYGVDGRAYAGSSDDGSWGTASSTTGVYGVADGGNACTIGYGVYGTATNSTTNWAGYFSGNVYCTGTYQGSDAALKTDISDIDVHSAAEILNGLQVHQYQYNQQAFPFMELPDGEQVGLIAQEVQELIPGLVKEATEPALVDADGNVLAESVSFKSINYTGLIPFLIAGYQDQNQRLIAMQEEIASLHEQLTACCASLAGDDQRLAPNGGVEDNPLLPAGSKDRLLRIAPNPFTERTTLYCTLERSGRMQLLANSADGRDLRVLSEAQREAGEYQYEWDTTALAPGVYYITMLLDGEPVVKKAVKVGR
ncbi:MAG: tail fiber domain-containing protein [Flavobacteriales bacterium]|nr:tail fiber domain-containing protein [Flavobacteriales bacterium]